MMKQVSFIVTLIVCSVFLLLQDKTMAKTANERLDIKAQQFVQQFRTFQLQGPRLSQWISSAESPWTELLKTPLDQTLSEKQKSQSLAFQNQGLCYKVLKIERIAFLKRHPFLLVVFKTQPDIQKIFDTEILYNKSRGFKRCRAIDVLFAKDFFEKDELKKRPLIRFTDDFEKNINMLSPIDLKLIYRFLGDILELALCRDYTPAIGDVLSWQQQKSFELSYETLFYLIKRAEKKKILTASLISETMQIKIKQRAHHKHIIEDAAFYGTVKKLQFAMNYWVKRCGHSNSIQF